MAEMLSFTGNSVTCLLAAGPVGTVLLTASATMAGANTKHAGGPRAGTTLASNWNTITESKFPWERDALEFVRLQFPDHEPYRAWANFEFIADDGSINEVDLLVFTPEGFFLIEIKSRPGRLTGDAGTWTWETDGRPVTFDNPLFLANTKAKKLRSLLERQPVARRKGNVARVEALIFCSAPDLNCELQGTARSRVCLRDRPATAGAPERPGIMAAIKRRECPGLDVLTRGVCNNPMAKLVGQAMEQAGIRPSQRVRKVSDYVLNQLIDEGPGYQDWHATHSQIESIRRRVRLYLASPAMPTEERAQFYRAAAREFQILESLQHPGILRCFNFTEHELGAALIFEHDPLWIRLDHFLMQQKDKLSVDARLNLVRQLAEIVQFAHDKKVIHRGLSPRSILVTDAAGPNPRLKVFNWQVGYRMASSTSSVSREVTATAHVDRLVDDASTAYMAPEALSESDNTGEHLDVFSLGAIAYHIFSGQPPAPNGLELSNRLRETKGLQISSVLNGAGQEMQFLIQYSTHPGVTNRLDSVADFRECLDRVEEELTTPDHDFVDDPNRATIGDLLPGNLKVVRRLGQGACSVAFLVERAGKEFVLKAANSPEHNARLKDEADVLGKLRHPHVVEYCELVEIGDRTAFLMRPVFAERDKQTIETLGHRLRKEGRLHIDLLQRFGEDLLDVVKFLEERGIPHRDIKPDNIAVGMLGPVDKLHLVLFDFSLSRMPPENIRAGTFDYLDPLLPLRKPAPRWDLYAERYAVAVTLYEMTTGATPKWGDDKTDPSHLGPETEITLEPEAFDPHLREAFTDFFSRAFRREPSERFDNAEEMLRTWRKCFEGIEEPGSLSDHADDSEFRQRLSVATYDTEVTELGLGTRASNALDRANILSVEDMLTVPLRRILRMRGVGNKTRREIAVAVRLLRERLGTPSRDDPTTDGPFELTAESEDVTRLSIDTLMQRIQRAGSRDGNTAQGTLYALLGLDQKLPERWPSQAEIAQALGVSRARIGQVVGKLQERWSKEPAITRLRSDVAGFLNSAGGGTSLDDLTESIIVDRGSVHDEPARAQFGRAVIRVACEVERMMAEPRFIVRRDRELVLIATSAEFAAYVLQLGKTADKLAVEDPLISPSRVVECLRVVSLPEGAPALQESRLIRLAVKASRHAAISSKQELYPRQMDPVRTLNLSRGALLGVPFMTVEQLRERVASRYPESAPLPDRPLLDELLCGAGLEDFHWDSTARKTGGYVAKLRNTISVTSGSEVTQRRSTSLESLPVGDVSPELADARQFEERLQRAVKEGSFLTLMVNPKDYQQAAEELRRFPVELVDFEGLFLDALREVAGQANVNWDLVLRTDATPGQGDWDKLMLLVGRVMPIIERQLSSSQKTLLVIYAGLLARYDRMDLLERLRDKVGRRDGIPGLWLLVPGDHQPLLDGIPIPLISPGQRARVPESWIENRHRATDDRGGR